MAKHCDLHQNIYDVYSIQEVENLQTPGRPTSVSRGDDANLPKDKPDRAAHWINAVDSADHSRNLVFVPVLAELPMVAQRGDQPGSSEEISEQTWQI